MGTEVSDAEVEAGSKANFEDETDLSWERAREDVKEINRRGIRIILEAAAKVRNEKVLMKNITGKSHWYISEHGGPIEIPNGYEVVSREINQ